jgi:uncharacterized membrane protein
MGTDVDMGDEHRLDRRLRVGAVIEQLRESSAAASGVGLAVGVGVGLLLGQVGVGTVLAGDADRQFDVLTTLLQALVTVIGVVLSMMVVNQQLASQQYSPRAIRTVLRDTPTRASLAGLFGYIGFMVAAIAAFGPDIEDPLSVPVAMVASVGALGLVAYLVQHLSEGFRADRLVARIAVDAAEAVQRISDRDDTDAPHLTTVERLDELPPHATALRAWQSGYLQDAAVTALARDLRRAGVRVTLAVHMGGFVGAGATLGWWWPAAGGTSGAGRPSDEDVQALIDPHLQLGEVKTTQREISSSIQQLIDVGLRALAPAINDPETAVEALNALTDVLQSLAERDQDWLIGAVDDEVVVVIPRPLVTDLVDTAVASLRKVAAPFPTVLDALIMLLRSMVGTRPGLRELALVHLDHIAAEAEGADLLEVDLRVVHRSLAVARTEMDPAAEHPGVRARYGVSAYAEAHDAERNARGPGYSERT